MKTFTAKTVEDLDLIAPEIIKAFGQHKVIALDAPMGAGKTTLVKAICNSLGSESIVNSPTFAIINDYELPGGNSAFHFDLYRIKSTDELINIGCDEYFYSGCYCFVEWPEIGGDLLPDDTLWVHISISDDGTRTITID